MHSARYSVLPFVHYWVGSIRNQNGPYRRTVRQSIKRRPSDTTYSAPCSTWNAKTLRSPQGSFTTLRRSASSAPISSAKLRASFSFRNSSRSTARETAQSYSPVHSAARVGRTFTLGSCRVASLRNNAFLRWDSIRSILQSGRSTAIGIPGKPPPEPMSAILNLRLGSHSAKNKDSQ